MKEKINTEKVTGDIVSIGRSCINLGVTEVAVSSMLLLPYRRNQEMVYTTEYY